jgi:hypothetical protein
VVAILIVAVIGSTIAYVDFSPAATPEPTATEIALATATPEPTPEATASPTPTVTPTSSPSPSPTPAMVAATTDGVWLPASEAAIATRKPIAVMIDDHAAARPQSGLSMANIVYQGPAEGGIPRYMAIFQTQEPVQIGPIRSSRLYFVAWAEEYRAAYVHMWGAPNAMGRLAQDNGKYIYNIDGLRYGGKSGYMWRTGFRVAPHNLYSSYAKLEQLTNKIGGKAPLATSQFVFADALPAGSRPIGGSITVPYSSNSVSYNYNHDTNTYPRRVSGEGIQEDAITGKQIAPSNVILLYMDVGLANCTIASCHKHRLEVNYLGKGTAMVFNNGLAIPARWSKKGEYSPTYITYASGPNAGKLVNMVRGQIFIQVVPNVTVVPTWSVGYMPPPESNPQVAGPLG